MASVVAVIHDNMSVVPGPRFLRRRARGVPQHAPPVRGEAEPGRRPDREERRPEGVGVRIRGGAEGAARRRPDPGGVCRPGAGPRRAGGPPRRGRGGAPLEGSRGDDGSGRGGEEEDDTREGWGTTSADEPRGVASCATFPVARSGVEGGATSASGADPSTSLSLSHTHSLSLHLSLSLSLSFFCLIFIFRFVLP